MWERGRHVGGKVGSQLQKKLIKNEKKPAEGGWKGGGGGQEWTEAGGGV